MHETYACVKALKMYILSFNAKKVIFLLYIYLYIYTYIRLRKSKEDYASTNLNRFINIISVITILLFR